MAMLHLHTAAPIPLALIAQAVPRLISAKMDDDAEEDDPSGQCDEDGINTYGDLVMYGVRYAGPGCAISDPDYGVDDTNHDREDLA